VRRPKCRDSRTEVQGLPSASGFCEYRGSVTDDERAQAYWRHNLMLVGGLLAVWFLVSLGCGVLFVDALDRYRIGGFKLGFWFAQQGSIYIFVLLIFFYAWRMNHLDQKFDVHED
jgi:putative solute:sodium symporter small subunit